MQISVGATDNERNAAGPESRHFECGPRVGGEPGCAGSRPDESAFETSRFTEGDAEPGLRGGPVGEATANYDQHGDRRPHCKRSGAHAGLLGGRSCMGIVRFGRGCAICLGTCFRITTVMTSGGWLGTLCDRRRTSWRKAYHTAETWRTERTEKTRSLGLGSKSGEIGDFFVEV